MNIIATVTLARIITARRHTADGEAHPAPPTRVWLWSVSATNPAGESREIGTGMGRSRVEADRAAATLERDFRDRLAYLAPLAEGARRADDLLEWLGLAGTHEAEHDTAPATLSPSASRLLRDYAEKYGHADTGEFATQIVRTWLAAKGHCGYMEVAEVNQ